VPLTALEPTSSSPAGGEFPVTPTIARVRLLRALAPGSLATLHVPDIGGTQKRFRQTSIYKLFTSPQMRRVFADAGLDLDQLNRMSASVQGPAGMNLGQLQRALQGEFVISLEDLELTEDSPTPAFKLLAGLSVAGVEHEMQQLLDFVVMAVGSDQKVQVEQGSLKGAAFTRFHVPGPPRMVVEAALYHDALLVGIGRNVVTDAIARLDDEAIEALPDAASFGRCMQRIGHANDIFRVHVDLAGIHARLRGYVPADVKPILDVLGFEHMKSVAAALSIEGKDLVMKSFLDSPGGKDFVTDLLRRHSADRRLLERIPAGASSFSLFTLDGQVVLNRLREKLKDGDRKQLEDGLEELKGEGIDLENELLRAFGPRFALVTVRAGRRDATGIDALWNHLLGTAFVVEIKDREKALKQLAKLPETSGDVRRSKETIGTTPVVTYRFPREHLPRGFSIVIAPMDDYLMVTLSRETMEQMLKPPSTETVAHFRSAIRGVPETAVAVSYDDLSQSTNFMMLAFMEGLRQARRTAGQPDATAPDLPSLAAHGANPSVSYTLADEHGVFTQTRSPSGGLAEVGGLTGVMAAAAVVVPALAAERMRSNEEEALRTMKQIRGAMAEYRAALVRDNDEDGEGENAFLAELIADEHARDGTANSRALLSDFERTPLGYRRSGYYFRAYLPAEDGSPIGEHESIKRRRQADGDLSENIVIVVAWPTRSGLTGNRSFLLDGSGKIHYCDGGYGGDESPKPDLLSSQEANLAAARIEKHKRARDGRRWLELR
jgi:hypothetical protein